MQKIIAIVVFLFLSFPALAADRALVMRIEGKAEVKRAAKNNFEALKLKDILNENDLIRTGKNSELMLTFRSIEIRLMSETELSLNDLKAGGKVSLNQGFSWYHVKQKQQSPFSVATPTSIASVRGTMFAIAGDSKGSISCVCTGEITSQSGAGGQVDSLKTGSSGVYDHKGKAGQKELKKYFNKLTVKPEFEKEVVSKDSRYAGCLQCHTAGKKKSRYRR